MTPPARATTSTPLDLANALVRAWTSAYTWRMEPAIRDTRRAEIDSELWEFQHDPERGAYPAAHVLARLVIGIPDDLSWRTEHARARRTPMRAGLRVLAWTVATLVVVAAWWILPLMTASTLPDVPPRMVFVAAPPPPGPPPPPPCAPAGFPQSRPCTP